MTKIQAAAEAESDALDRLRSALSTARRVMQELEAVIAVSEAAKAARADEHCTYTFLSGHRCNRTRSAHTPRNHPFTTEEN